MRLLVVSAIVAGALGEQIDAAALKRIDGIEGRLNALKAQKEPLDRSGQSTLEQMFERLQEMTSDTKVREMPAAAEQPDLERVRTLSDRYEHIKKKIMSTPELRKDSKVMATLDRISSKFERVKKSEGPKMEASESTTPDMEASDEEADADMEASDEEADEDRLEALQQRFERIRRKISATPELRKNSKIAANFRRVSSKFDKLLEMEKSDGEDEEEKASPDETDADDNLDLDGVDQERTTLPSGTAVTGDEPVDLERMHDDDQKEAPQGNHDQTSDDLERQSLSDRFKSIKSKVTQAGLDKDAKVASALKRISAKFERLTAHGKRGDSAKRGNSAAPSDQEQIGTLAKRFKSIKSKVKEAGLDKDAKVASALKRISAKFERLADGEGGKSAAPSDQERLRTLKDRFNGIKQKVESTPELDEDKEVSAALNRVSAKFERLDDHEDAPKRVPNRKRRASRASLEPAVVETDA
jgi:hypothetical protein